MRIYLTSVCITLSISLFAIISCRKSESTVTPTSATVTALSCGSATFSTTAVSGAAYTATAAVPYSGGSGGTYAAGSTIASTGVTGLTATLVAGTLASTGNLTFTISGTPSAAGTAVFPLTFGGQSCSLSLSVNAASTSTTGSSTVFPAFTVGNGTTAQLVTAANTFLATLDATQKAAVLLDFTSTKKSVWSNFPISDVTRNGLLTGTLTATQRSAAYALIAMLCSQYGYEELGKTMVADQYLVDTTKPSWTGGTANYAIAIFGTPSTTTPWMIQYGGHHMAINATIIGANNVFTPSLNGAQPNTFTSNGTTVRVWANQTDKGFAFVNALTATQQTKAILNYTVNDLVLGPGNDGKTIVPEGIKGSDLTAEQQTQLLDLISQWTNIANTTAATAKLAEIKATIADTYFAWSGPLTAGSVVYFRIQGPTVVIEYSSQQKNAAHIHNMYRDPTNDYGKKLL